MASCQIPGHPDCYGLGIRVAFYVQWFGMILTSWISPLDGALNLRFLNGLTVTATAIGLAVQLGDLEPAEVLVGLLLVCGALYWFVPVYAWKMTTLCRQWWDPELWTRVRLGPLFKTGLFCMAGAVLCFQLWFWTLGIHDRPSSSSSVGSSCHQYGFIFAPVRLDNAVLITFNIALHFMMLVVGTWMFASWAGLCDACHWYRRRKKEKWRTTPGRIQALQEFRTISDIVVASVVTSAIELIISWNQISGVNNLDTAAQLIPATISIAYLFRSFYLWVLSPLSESSRRHSSGTNTPSQRSRSQLPPHILYFPPGSDWTRRQRRRQSRYSGYYYHYDDHYMPQMTTATPSVPHATYTQQYRPATAEDAPAAEGA